MKIVTVIPLVRGVFREHLTYFSAQDINPGDLITVPVRQKMANALVVATESLTETKTDIRKASFGLKKVGQIKAREFLPETAIGAAREIADYSAAPLGAVLKSLLPPIMLSQTGAKKSAPASADKINDKIPAEKLVLQDSDEERLSFYKGLVREAFAKKQSVFICEPIMADLLAVKPILEKGIEHYTVVLYGQLNQKLLKENWRRVLTSKHPLLIIGTPSFLPLPRSDLATVIIDREGAGNYRAPTRPFVDYRRFAETLSAKRQYRLLLGDILLRPETMWRVESGELTPARSPRQRLPYTNEVSVITPKTGEVWSEEALDLITQTTGANEKLFLLANRLGLAPLIVCDDCGQSVLCNNCDSPLVLHQANLKQGVPEKTIFRCHHCGETRTAEERCHYCHSWRLRALGTGIDRVARELKTIAPDRPQFQLDSEHVKNYREAESLVRKFLDTPGGILLGTEMALNYLRRQVTHSIVVTIDAMMALPDFRINEKIFTLLARLRAITTKKMLVQTRRADNETLLQMSRGQLLEFYRQEIAEREKFGYPPFKVFIKITRAGSANTLRPDFKHLAELFADYEPVAYPSLHQPGRGLLELNLLLKLSPAIWPKAELVERLKSLPPDYLVRVDPETIL